MGGESSAMVLRSQEGHHVLRLAGPLLNVEVYDLVGRVEELDLQRGHVLTVDVSGVSDIDVTGLVALRRTFEVVLAQGVAVVLDLDKHEHTPLGEACQSMLRAAELGS